MRRQIGAIFLFIPAYFFFALLSPQTLFASQSSLTSGCIGLTASPSAGNLPLNVNFSGKGFDQGHSISLYEFDFGDSSGGQPRIVRQTSSIASHRYYNPGTYTASLKVQTSKGQFVGGGECTKTIAAITSKPLVQGARTKIETLPKTGAKDYLGIIPILSIVLGIYLRKHFKLSYRSKFPQAT